jgi:hypothetical protein
MDEKITETVTVTRPVDPRIADLVRFAQWLGVKGLTQEQLVQCAKDFWDNQHGED